MGAGVQVEHACIGTSALVAHGAVRAHGDTIGTEGYDIPARRARLRVSELKQRDALNADGVHTGGRALGWHTVRASVCLRNVSEAAAVVRLHDLRQLTCPPEHTVRATGTLCMRV